MLENRMRRPSKPLTNEESLRTIKSTDSKKMVMPIPQNKLKEENVEIEESFKEI